MNQSDAWGYAPLHEAAIKGKADVCIGLLQSGANHQATNGDGKTPMELAEGRWKIVFFYFSTACFIRTYKVDLYLLLTVPICIDRNYSKKAINPQKGAARSVLLGEYRKEELLESARTGNEERLLQLLTPLNINCQASDGRKSSPLHLAAGYNRVRIVQILLKQGPFTGAHWPLADVLAKDKGGLVPLHNSCSYGHGEVVEILLKCGANPNSADLWQFTPLHEAAQKGRVDVCNLLLAYGADPHVINCHGKSALELASAELADQLARTYRGCKLLESCQQESSESLFFKE